MDAIILAGGLGTRLRSVVSDVPKPLAPVNGRPFLDALLECLDRFPHIGNVVLTVGYGAETIKERYADTHYHFSIVFSYEESPLGTGGAIKHALPLTTGDDVIVLNGDTYSDVEIGELLKFHQEKNGVATIAVAMKEGARYGAVAFDDDHKIYSFDEKSGASDFVNAGTSVLRRSLFDSVSDGTVCSLEKDLIPQWLKQGVYAYVHQDGFLDIGTPESYAESGWYLNTRKKR